MNYNKQLLRVILLITVCFSASASKPEVAKVQSVKTGNGNRASTILLSKTGGAFGEKDALSIINTLQILGYKIDQKRESRDSVLLVKKSAHKKDKSVSLFNGENLDGWKTFIQDEKGNKSAEKDFVVGDNMIHVNGKEVGYIITEKSFENYHLKVDFKWGVQKWPPRLDAKRDAGICYHIPLNEPDKIFPACIECQIQEGDTGDFWLIGNSTVEVDGKANEPADYTRILKRKDAEKPYGEWNTVEVISCNGKCIHIVNGEIVNYGENASLKSGRILLQSEYAEVFYKNITIQEL